MSKITNYGLFLRHYVEGIFSSESKLTRNRLDWYRLSRTRPRNPTREGGNRVKERERRDIGKEREEVDLCIAHYKLMFPVHRRISNPEQVRLQQSLLV